MAFQAAPGIVEAALRFLWDDQLVENVLHFHKADEVIDSTAMGLLGEALAGWVSDSLLPVMSNTVSFANIHLRSLELPNGLVLDVNGGFVTGEQAADPMPNDVTLAISFRSGFAGRSYRGRAYHIGVTRDMVSQNTFLTTPAGDILNAWTALAAAIPAGWTHVVLSRISGGAPRAFGIGIDIFSYILTDLTVDAQRRRLPGRGT